MNCAGIFLLEEILFYRFSEWKSSGIIEITCLKKEGDAYDRANLFGYWCASVYLVEVAESNKQITSKLK